MTIITPDNLAATFATLEAARAALSDLAFNMTTEAQREVRPASTTLFRDIEAAHLGLRGLLDPVGKLFRCVTCGNGYDYHLLDDTCPDARFVLKSKFDEERAANQQRLARA